MSKTKQDFVNIMKEAYGKNANEAGIKRAHDALFEAIASELETGNSVTIYQFGTFNVKESKEREGRNPATGEKLTIPATKRPKFKASTALQKRVQ